VESPWPGLAPQPRREFLDLEREGKVRAIGLSNHDIYQLEAAAEIGNVDAIQPPFNLLHRDAADDVLLWPTSPPPSMPPVPAPGPHRLLLLRLLAASEPDRHRPARFLAAGPLPVEPRKTSWARQEA